MILHIAALDVGHADCLLVYDDSRTSVLLIDCGDADSLLDFLETEQIGQIDLAVVTHNDADHVRGMSTLIARMPVGCLALHPTINNLSGIPKRIMTRLQETVRERGTPVADISTECRRLGEQLG